MGRLSAVCPLYPELGRDFCVLEAGYMGQLLMEEASSSGLGLCPLGGVSFAAVRDRFDLEGTDELVYAMAGGTVTGAAASPAAPPAPEMVPAGSPAAAGGPFWQPNPGPESRDFKTAAIYDPIGRLEFKLKQHALRPLRDLAVVELPAQPVDEEVKRIWAERRSFRHYLPEPVPLTNLGAWLSCLGELEAQGLPGPKIKHGDPKYRYPSAEHSYAVQCYLHVKEGRVEGVEAGTWYYEPHGHRLVLLHPGVEIDRSLHGPPNQPIFDEAAFSVFLVARLAAVAPLYPKVARELCLLEAGHMGQLLMTEGVAHRIGLTPLGGVGFEPIRHLFDLEPDHDLVHTFVGGRGPAGPATLEAAVAEQQADARSFGQPPADAPPNVDPSDRTPRTPRLLGPEALPGAGPDELREFSPASCRPTWCPIYSSTWTACR